MLCDLKNKNSDLYLEVVKAINKFNDTCGGKHTISKKISKNILGKVDIFIKKCANCNWIVSKWSYKIFKF